MKSSLKLVGLASFALAAVFLPGCGAGDIGADDPGMDGSATLDEGDIGTAEQGLMSCSNPDGTNAAMAALAVNVARELGRWHTSVDFVNGWNGIALASGSDANGPIGKSRCADGVCARVQAILDMQSSAAQGKVYFQGSGTTKVLLDPNALKSRISAKYEEQKVCDNAPRDGTGSDCTTELNKLTYVSNTPGGCDTNFTFSVTTPSGAALRYPTQLQNEVKFADSQNPYINFQNLGGGKISIDPTYGLADDGVTSTGSCTAACTKISTTNIAGSCCSCAGVTKTFVKSAFSSSVYLCS